MCVAQAFVPIYINLLYPIQFLSHRSSVGTSQVSFQIRRAVSWPPKSKVRNRMPQICSSWEMQRICAWSTVHDSTSRVRQRHATLSNITHSHLHFPTSTRKHLLPAAAAFLGAHKPRCSDRALGHSKIGGHRATSGGAWFSLDKAWCILMLHLVNLNRHRMQLRIGEGWLVTLLPNLEPNLACAWEEVHLESETDFIP